jgi:cyclohexadieny/prephenate dehydrogenase
VFKQITILAPGLLGASLAIAVRRRALAERIHIWARRPEARIACARESWCDAVFETPEESVSGSDLVVLCAPVSQLGPLAQRCAPGLKAGALVTDVGSTKSGVSRECNQALPPNVTFIGSHPMAGSEKSGMEHADGNLFERRACIVTPLAETNETLLRALHDFWKAVGMEVSMMSPEKHDEIVAHISHLPHILASALCVQLSGLHNDWWKLAGGGLRDTSRIASGHPALWREIIEQNRDEILRSVEGFENALHNFKSALYNNDYLHILQLLEAGKRYRDQLPEA